MGNKNSDLNKAIHEHNKTTILQLLKSGACLIDGDGKGIPPPIVVCLESGFAGNDINDTRRCHILETLAEHGADVNVKTSRGETAAMVVAMFGFLDCLKTLVESGADLTLTSPTGDTALTLAAMMGQEACVRYLTKNMLLTSLSHKNDKGKTALMLAASNPADGYVQSLRHLIDAGANLNITDKDGYTPLMLAISRNSVKGVALLLKKDCLVDTVSHAGETPLTLCLESTTFSGADIIPLLHHGLDPTRSSLDKNSVHVLIKSGDKRAVRALVGNGFPPLDIYSVSNVIGSDYFAQCMFKFILPSPLSLAIVNLLPDVAKYLVLNCFLTRFDITRLCWQPEIRAFLLEEILSGSNPAHANKCLEILDFLSQNPRSLFVLSLIQVSSSLSQDFLQEPASSLNQNRSHFVCRPSFRERVHLLNIPPKLKRTLLHRTHESRICCQFWDCIPIGRHCTLAECSCTFCNGEHEIQAVQNT